LYKEGPWILYDTQVLGSDGHYKWENLEWGNYKLVEVIAPAGYILAPDQYITIDAEKLEVILKEEIADPRKPGKVIIDKNDENGDPLVGAGFTIYYKDSGLPVMAEKFTDDPGGKCTFDNLEWGTYRISETTVPGGYTKAEDIIMTIGPDEAEAGVYFTINNKKKTTTTTTTTTTAQTGGIEVLGISELPFTGMNPAIPISGISTIIGGILMLGVSFRRRKYNKK